MAPRKPAPPKPAPSKKSDESQRKRTRPDSSGSGDETRPRRSRRKKAGQPAEESSDSEDSEPAQPPPKKRRKRPKKVATDDSDDQVPEVVGAQTEHESEVEIFDSRHDSSIPAVIPVKAKTDDLDLMFLPRSRVKFDGEEGKELKGRWCIICHADKTKAPRKAFFVGGNSTLRQHIRQHYAVFKEKANEKGIEISRHCKPPEVLRAEEAEAAQKEDVKAGRDPKRGKLTGMGFTKRLAPKEFTRGAALEHISKFIVLTDQSLETANNPTYRNPFVVFRPDTRSSELPSAYKVKTFVHNEYVAALEEMRETYMNTLGKVSTVGDGWTADNTKESYLGMNAFHVKLTKKKGQNIKFSLEMAMIGFRWLQGKHDGANMARYFLSACIRVGIIDPDKKISKLGPITLDNASPNATMCENIEDIARRLGLDRWDCVENQLMCLGHVLNLSVGDVMAMITKTAALETTQAIWEYDPSDPDNRILGGTLDVVAAARTLGVKIQASGQRIQVFKRHQLDCDIANPLSIILHGNTRWGTAYGMVERVVKLKQPIARFVAGADELFGPITVIRRQGSRVKKIHWSAFRFEASDWRRLEDLRDILQDVDEFQQAFSSQRHPTMYIVIPAIEDLQTAWEDKLKEPDLAPYHAAIQAGLDKIGKYYTMFDSKPAYVLGLFIHPYYKFEWIKENWGGQEEYDKAVADGDPNPRNWVDEAEKLIEKTVKEYWQYRFVFNTDPNAVPVPAEIPDEDLEDDEILTADIIAARAAAAAPAPAPAPAPAASQPQRSGPDESRKRERPTTAFERSRMKRAAEQNGGFTGWQAELHAWCTAVEHGVSAKTDVCEWWSTNAHRYPTIARLAVDAIPNQASSVSAEFQFLSSKRTASDQRSRLGTSTFEELQVMKAKWRPEVVDFARMNENKVEVVDMDAFEGLLAEDEEQTQLDKLCGDSMDTIAM